MKQNFILTVLFALAVVTWSCGNHTAEKTKGPDTVAGYIRHPKTMADSDKNDSLAMAQVEQLPEFNNMLKWYQQANKDTSRHISVIISQEPTKGFGYYWVKVGEDAPGHFTDMEHFYVDTAHLAVHYLDMEYDSVLTLSQWRKSGKDKWLK
jgi:hypothetical protein